jgi:uncharacterized protein
MQRVSIILATITAVLILCQWFVYSCLRKYLLQRYEDISRKTAYFVLAALSLFNVLAIGFVFNPEMTASYPVSKLWVTVAYFSFLGYVLLLTMLFCFLWVASYLPDLKNKCCRFFAVERSIADALQSKKGHPEGEHESGSCEKRAPAARSQFTDTDIQSYLERGPQDPGGKHPGPTRRAFLKWTAATGVVVAAAAVSHGVAEAYESPSVEKFVFFHDMLNDLNRPITVIQITDFHFGFFLGIPQLQRLVQELNSIEGDALLLTGDVFHSPLSPVELATPVLKRLRPRRFGNFVVMGNHDFYAGERRSVTSFEQSGLTLLRGQWVTFEDGACRIHVGGIDDPRTNWLWGTKFKKFDQFVKRAPKEKGIRILLSHRPAIFPQAVRAGIDLVLAGHIHGGQIILPVPGDERGFSLATLVSDYTHGWYGIGAGRMYLNRGIGLTFVPWRINCPPEISVLQLKPTQGRVASGEFIRV